ncbi:MAG TPA: MFS transporter [Candidatus Limnocylindria bacterium]|nr:MFS transporter [Candidatus Limnocylindria bacterium]
MRGDFWKFWAGETVSSFGNSITLFGLPLLVFQLSGSAVSLGITFALFGLPHLLFGLLIGAWVDRVDRKRVMIVVDILSAIIVAAVPAGAALGVLSIGLIYAVAFLSATLSIFFQAAQFAAIPSLVDRAELVAANGRIQASFSAATVAGPLLAGALLVFVPLERLLLIDSATFLVSAVMLALIARRFDTGPRAVASSLRADVAEGLRYVLRHPVLRSISVMMALINFVGVTAYAQLVLLAKQRFGASDAEIALLFAADGAGVVLLSLAAGPLRRRWSFANVALGALMLNGLLTIALAYAPVYPAAVVLAALASGLGILFNINSGSLRQAIVPQHMLGRIITIAMVLAWSANPLGATLGGIVVERVGDVSSVYAVIGGAIFLIALWFRLFSPLRDAEAHLPPRAAR